ncbi:MAG: glycosyltransferase [Alistipes sp.]|nr:glycosyltransferase [Alistipes sp.]
MATKSTPLVSVVVTTFNHESYLAEALDAILSQRCNFGVEIVLGEDCSSDNTLAICQEYAERYPDTVKLIASTENVGWRENYRRCVEAAQGQLIAFCDGDDYWCDENRLAEQVALMEQNRNVGLCYTLAERRDENGALVGRFPIEEGHITLDAMLHDWCVENCTTLASRELILDYYATEKPENHPEWLTEDLPMWLYVAAHSEVAYIDKATAVHRVFPDSVSHSTSLAKRLAFCDSSSNIKLWFDERYNNSKQRRYLLRERINTALWVYSHIGSVGDFVKRWWQEIKENKRGVCNIFAYGLFIKKLFRICKKANG